MGDESQLYAFITEALDGLRRDIKADMAQYVTKAELALVTERLANEIAARERLERKLTADEQERKAKGRRLWGSIWGLFLVVLATFGANLLHIHF